MRLLSKARIYSEWLFSRVTNILGKGPDPAVIPPGMYCYRYLESDRRPGVLSFRIERCPYYRSMGDGCTACLYTGFFGYDLAHADQCKICDENQGELGERA